MKETKESRECSKNSSAKTNMLGWVYNSGCQQKIDSSVTYRSCATCFSHDMSNFWVVWFPDQRNVTDLFAVVIIEFWSANSNGNQNKWPSSALSPQSSGFPQSKLLPSLQQDVIAAHHQRNWYHFASSDCTGRDFVGFEEIPRLYLFVEFRATGVRMSTATNISWCQMWACPELVANLLSLSECWMQSWNQSWTDTHMNHPYKKVKQNWAGDLHVGSQHNIIYGYVCMWMWRNAYFYHTLWWIVWLHISFKASTNDIFPYVSLLSSSRQARKTTWVSRRWVHFIICVWTCHVCWTLAFQCAQNLGAPEICISRCVCRFEWMYWENMNLL